MRRLLALLLILPTLASAQSKGGRACRILFLGAPQDAPKKLHLYDGTASQEVELPQMNFSQIYKLAAGDLTLRLLPSAPLKPEEVSPESPKATIAAGITDFYLLVSSDPTNKIAPVRMQIVDADASKFRKGQMLWFNLTPNSVGGQLGSRQLAMTANSRVIVDAPVDKDGQYNVNLSFRMPGNEQLYPLCETKWTHDSRSRSVFFIVMEPGSRAPRILGFPDFREETPEKSQTP